MCSCGGVMSPFVSPLSVIVRAHDPTVIGSARGSHIDVAWRSVCDRDQKWNQAINALFRSRSRDQDEFWVTKINRSTHFRRYLAGVATFCPWNSRRIKRSRASKRSDQAIKDDFHRSKFLIPVANASTCDVYVTTPCSVMSWVEKGQSWCHNDGKKNFGDAS